MGQRQRPSDDTYSDQEAQRRFEVTLRAAFNTPHKPQSAMKLGKRRGKSSKSPKQHKAQSRKKNPNDA
jgi:hypothetical protein